MKHIGSVRSQRHRPQPLPKSHPLFAAIQHHAAMELLAESGFEIAQAAEVPIAQAAGGFDFDADAMTAGVFDHEIHFHTTGATVVKDLGRLWQCRAFAPQFAEYVGSQQAALVWGVDQRTGIYAGPGTGEHAVNKTLSP